MTPKITRKQPAFISHSAGLRTDFAVYAEAPDPADGPGPWPAAVFVDGDYMFDGAIAVYRELRKKKLVPPAVIAAVGYGAPFGSPKNHRGRDYTPTAGADEPASGGAGRFLDHLTGPLWSELAGRYPLRADGHILGGHSLGSLFVLHALFQDRPFFRRALASAPSIWWDQRSILKQIAQLRDQQSALPARLFLGVGENDSASMVGDLALLDQQLRARPFEGLQISSTRFLGRDHYTSPPDALRAGLAELLGS